MYNVLFFPQVVELLLEFHCKVNLFDNQQRTALHLAGGKCLPSVVEKLIRAGAQINPKDKWRRTPLHVTLMNVSHNHTASEQDNQMCLQVSLSKLLFSIRICTGIQPFPLLHCNLPQSKYS